MRSRLKKKVGHVTSQNIELERLFSFLFIFFILCHNLACLWFLVAKLQDFEDDTWVARYGQYGTSVERQYLAALYFIVTTITTVGYGDITSQNPAEQIFCLILMVVGVIAYSTAISSISGIMSAANYKSKRLLSRLNVLSRLRDEYDINFELYWRLRQTLHHHHQYDMSEQHDFMTNLPQNLSVEPVSYMYAHEIAGL